jgi:hypothetical protein
MNVVLAPMGCDLNILPKTTPSCTSPPKGVLRDQKSTKLVVQSGLYGFLGEEVLVSSSNIFIIDYKMRLRETGLT